MSTCGLSSSHLYMKPCHCLSLRFKSSTTMVQSGLLTFDTIWSAWEPWEESLKLILLRKEKWKSTVWRIFSRKNLIVHAKATFENIGLNQVIGIQWEITGLSLCYLWSLKSWRVLFTRVLWIFLLTQSLSTSLAFYAVVPLFNNYSFSLVLYSALVPKLMSYIWTLRKHSTPSLIRNFFTNFGTLVLLTVCGSG